jgi:hypothetical protein
MKNEQFAVYSWRLGVADYDSGGTEYGV